MLGLTFLLHVKFLSTKVSILNNIFNFALNAKKLHYGQGRYKQIESGFCGTETYSKVVDRTSRTRPCNRIRMVYQYRTAET